MLRGTGRPLIAGPSVAEPSATHAGSAAEAGGVTASSARYEAAADGRCDVIAGERCGVSRRLAGSRGRRLAPVVAMVVAMVVVVCLAAVGCGPPNPDGRGQGTTVVGSGPGSTGGPEVAANASTTEPTPAVPPPPERGPDDARAVLAALRIDDQPRADGYRRDEWPHWRDIDDDGCDAREQALKAASDPPAQVGRGCHVTAGGWRSAYDGQEFTTPSGLDVDHVVPLENAHESGGWSWSTDRRALFANDQADLWVVSAASNRSKGPKAPDQWRPPVRDVWCEYATRWLGIKIRWDLSATTSERDALGQMLDTC